MRKRIPLFIAAAVALAACNAGPTPTSAPVVAPQVTLYAPTTPTSQPPTAAPTQAVRATSAVPAATPPAATAAPPAGPNVNPFTGIAQASPISRRAVIVKVANTADIRPQTGLQAADVAIEHIMEGGDTRISALYLTNAPARVGSVRSCRLVDIELTAIFSAGLVCSGTSPGVKPIIRAAPHLFDKGGTLRDGVAIISDFGPYECPACAMFRSDDRPMPNNLWANLANAWKELDDRKRNQPSAFRGFRFDAAPPAGGLPVDAVRLNYRISPSSWKYDAATGKWLRSVLDRPHIDVATNAQITSDNVLVLQVPHVDTLIEEDTLGSKSVEIQLWNSGQAKLFRDGQMYEGSWRRDSTTGLNTIELRDRAGAPFAFKPGNTWIQIIATGSQVTP